MSDDELARRAEADAIIAKRRTDLADAIIARRVCEQSFERDLVDPEACVALIDRNKLIYDDDGRPLNVLEALDELLTDRPYLVGKLSRRFA